MILALAVASFKLSATIRAVSLHAIEAVRADAASLTDVVVATSYVDTPGIAGITTSCTDVGGSAGAAVCVTDHAISHIVRFTATCTSSAFTVTFPAGLFASTTSYSCACISSGISTHTCGGVNTSATLFTSACTSSDLEYGVCVGH